MILPLVLACSFLISSNLAISEKANNDGLEVLEYDRYYFSSLVLRNDTAYPATFIISNDRNTEKIRMRFAPGENAFFALKGTRKPSDLNDVDTKNEVDIGYRIGNDKFIMLKEVSTVLSFEFVQNKPYIWVLTNDIPKAVNFSKHLFPVDARFNYFIPLSWDSRIFITLEPNQ